MSIPLVAQNKFQFNYQQWETHADQPLSANALQGLLDNEIPAIRIKHFATAAECETLARVIHEAGVFEGYTFANNASSILKIGPAQCEFGAERKAQYFDAGAKAQRLLDLIKSTAFNPVDRVMAHFAKFANVEIPEEKNHGKYFAGVIRNLSKGGLLHMDYAPWDARNWAIQNVQQQLSWNLYLKAPRAGGLCTVHNRQWDPSDEAYKFEGSYHYHSDVVEGAEKKVHSFIEGDLVLFNTRNFHEISESEGLRLTMSSFVGRKPNGNLVFWS